MIQIVIFKVFVKAICIFQCYSKTSACVHTVVKLHLTYGELSSLLLRKQTTCYQLSKELNPPNFSLRMLYWSLCCWIWESCCVRVICICSFWDDMDDTCSFSSWIWASWGLHNGKQTGERIANKHQMHNNKSTCRAENNKGTELCAPDLWWALYTELLCCHVVLMFSSLPPPSSPPHWICELLWWSYL